MEFFNPNLNPYKFFSLSNKMWSLYKNEKLLNPLVFSNGKNQEDIVVEVEEAIKEGHKIIFIKGMCGTGKSAIALNLARSMGKTSIIVPITPILWVLSPSPIYLILVPSLIGGIAWAGFDLATVNFIYDNVSKEKRGLASSYFNLMTGIGIALAA